MFKTPLIRSVLTRLAVIVGVVVVAAGALYALSPWLMSSLLSAWLQNQGAYAVALEAGYPGLRSVRFATVRARWTTEGARYAVSAQDVTVGYRMTDVLRGRVDSVRVGASELSYQSNGPLQASDLALVFGLAGPWIGELALGAATFDALTVHFGEAGEGTPDLHLSGSVNADGRSLSARLRAGFGEAPPQEVSLQMNSAGVMELQLRARDSKDAPPWLSLHSSRSGGGSALRGTLDTRAEAATAALAPVLPAGDWAAVEGAARGEWNLVLPMQPADWLELLLQTRGTARVQADLSAGGGTQNPADALQGELEMHAGDRELLSSGTLASGLRLPSRVLALLGVPAPWPQDLDGRLSLNWSGTVPVEGTGNWTALLNHAGLEADADLRVAGAQRSSASAQDVRVQTQVVLRDARLRSEGSLEGNAGNAAVLIEHWTGGSGWPFPRGDLSARWKLAGPVSAPTHPDGWLGVLEADASLSGDLELDRIDGLARALRASGKAQARLKGGRLSLHAEPGLQVSGIPDEQLLPGMAAAAAPLTVEVPQSLDATMSVRARRYRLNLPVDAELEIKDLVLNDAAVPSLRVRALKPIDVTRAGDGPWTYDSVSLSLSAPVAFLNLKVLGPIEKLRSELLIVSRPEQAQPLLTFRDLTVDMLGGRVSCVRLAYDAKGAVNELPIEVSGVDLGRVLRLEQQPGLQASGRVDGRVSLLLGPDGVESGSGRFSARPGGGAIRYQPDAGAQRAVEANQSLKFAHKALGNLRYEVLNADGDYGSDGTLRLRVKIEGVNPDWQPNQPIHLNLNLEENVPKLLESLRISDDFSRVIEKRVEEFYRQGGATP